MNWSFHAHSGLSLMQLSVAFKNWAASWQNQKVACAPSEDSDQPGLLPSLIRVFAVRMKKAWFLSYSLSAQRRLISLGGCPGWSESSLGAHATLLVLSWGGSIYCYAFSIVLCFCFTVFWLCSIRISICRFSCFKLDELRGVKTLSS